MNRIAITNHTGARNRGCEALVHSMSEGFRRYHPDLGVALHSCDPLYDQWRFGNSLKTLWGYPLLSPNHTRYKELNRLAYAMAALGERILPETIRDIEVGAQKNLKQADAIVAAGGDIFTSDYGNLRKHLAYPLMAGKKPVYLCSHSIGPFTPADRDYFRAAAKHIDLISVRERDSYDYLKTLDIQTRVEFTADVAFTLPHPAVEQSAVWLQRHYGINSQKPMVAISVSQGIIKYSGLDAEAYYQCFAGLCDALLAAGKQILLIAHVMEKNPANNDVIACDEVLERVRAPGLIQVLSGEPGAQAIKGAIGLCEALVGTRTHATIASISQGIPTVSVAYSRKAYGIMKDVYGDELCEKLTLPAEGLSTQALLDAFEMAIRTPIDAQRLDAIKERAERNFTLLDTLLEPT